MEAGMICNKKTVGNESKIMVLKQQLAATDYKIIKCSEYQLSGLELPYDVAALHTERQTLRDGINELEGGNAQQP